KAPYDVIFRHSSTHVLARELTPESVESSIAGGRMYSANDWLCDPAGFSFVAENNFGAYDIGDTVPLMGGTNLAVTLPVAGSIRILRDGNVVAEKNDSRLI